MNFWKQDESRVSLAHAHQHCVRKCCILMSQVVGLPSCFRTLDLKCSTSDSPRTVVTLRSFLNHNTTQNTMRTTKTKVTNTTNTNSFTEINSSTSARATMTSTGLDCGVARLQTSDALGAVKVAFRGRSLSVPGLCVRRSKERHVRSFRRCAALCSLVPHPQVSGVRAGGYYRRARSALLRRGYVQGGEKVSLLLTRTLSASTDANVCGEPVVSGPKVLQRQQHTSTYNEHLRPQQLDISSRGTSSRQDY